MPEPPDYRKGRRPPPRKSWEDPDEEEDSDSDSRNGPPSRWDQGGGQYGSRPDTSLSRGQKIAGPKANEAPIQNLSSGWGGKQKLTDDERDDLNKRNQKRLIKMLCNQALCLSIIFGLISAFNWMANDYSGEYVGQSNQLRTVRLTLGRRISNTDAHLTYGGLGELDLDTSKDQPSPEQGKLTSLDFITPEKFRQPGERVWLANFTGHIDSGQAVGTLTDSTGEYPVKLEKNVLTSLFGQLQGHTPKLPSVRPPTFFDQRTAKPVHGPSGW